MDFVGVIEDGNLVDRHAFLEVTGRDGDFVLSFVERQAEGDDLVSALGLDLLSVMEEGDFPEGGIDLDFRHFLVAVDIAGSAEMEELFLAPIGLVEIEGILLQFSVEGDKSLVVLSGIASLVPSVRSEVEHVPDMRGPEVGMSFEAFQKVLMVDALVFFRVVEAFRLGRMEIGHAFGTVFGIAKDSLGIEEVEEGNPEVVEEEEGDIPAKVEVPGDDVGQVGRLVEGRAHGIAGKGRLPVGINLVEHVIEAMMEAKHGLAVLVDHGDFVGNAPDDDGRMVVLLIDEFLHLLDGILVAVCEMLGNIGDFRPDDHALLVAEIIEEIIVLVMGKTDGVGADFLDHGHVLDVVFPGDGVSLSEAVLMPGDATQRVETSIEEESLLAVEGEGAESEAAGDLVKDRAILIDKAGKCGIEIGVFPSVPEMDVLDRSRFVVLEMEDDVSVLVLDFDFDFLGALRESVDGDFSLGVLGKGIDLNGLASEVV